MILGAGCTVHAYAWRLETTDLIRLDDDSGFGREHGEG
jgi:hypothetical protein